MLRRLSIRIAILILVMGPTLLIAAIILGMVPFGSGVDNRLRVMVTLPLVAFGIPLLLGVVVAHFISEPLRTLAEAIGRLHESTDVKELEPTDIAEFEGVVTEFNRLRARLAREEALRRDLISDTAHELNNPLTALAGQVKGMQDGVLDITPQRLQILGDQIDRLTDLTVRLQQYAQIRASALRPEVQSVDVGELAERVRRRHELDLSARSMSFHNEALEYTAQGDPRLLEQLLDNLISNAIRHSHGTAIVVSAAGDQIAVSDNGKGIPEGSLPDIFERFSRIGPSRNGDGLGLGLAIAREIAETHGWRIAVRNTHPGICFTLSIPSRQVHSGAVE